MNKRSRNVKWKEENQGLRESMHHLKRLFDADQANRFTWYLSGLFFWCQNTHSLVITKCTC
jgi:hypothetical protein